MYFDKCWKIVEYQTKHQSLLLVLCFAGLHVTEDELKQAAFQSGVLDVADDFITTECRAECERIIDIDHLKPGDCKEAFLYFKRNFSL